MESLVPKEIFEKFLDGDQNSIAVIYEKYKNLMFFVISTFIKTKEDAEDVLQESFIKAVNHREQIKKSNKLKAYLMSTCKHTALDFIKKQNKYTSTDLIDEIYGNDDNDFLNFLEPVLTNKETLVIYYRIVFDLSWKDIVDITRISESALRLIYNKAIKKLKEVYKDALY